VAIVTNKGFLLVLMQPPPALEEEFNDWYNTEHIPERRSVPGFETALRFVCLDGHPRYLAMYDLTSVDVLNTDAYKRISGENFSPWTKRVTSRVRIYRSYGVQIYPGALVTQSTVRTTLLRFSGLSSAAGNEVVAGMRANFDGCVGLVQMRVLAYERGNETDFLGFVELAKPVNVALDLSRFGLVGKALDMINTYAPYQ
jgi:hypothetical protein